MLCVLKTYALLPRCAGASGTGFIVGDSNHQRQLKASRDCGALGGVVVAQLDPLAMTPSPSKKRSEQPAEEASTANGNLRYFRNVPASNKRLTWTAFSDRQVELGGRKVTAVCYCTPVHALVPLN